MSLIVLDPAKFEHELAIRGLSRSQVAEGAGLRESTVRRIARGLPVMAESVQAVIRYLRMQPVDEDLAQLIGSLVVPAAS